MGDDEIIPNGSVHWVVTHEEVNGQNRRKRRWQKQNGNIVTDANEAIQLGGGQDANYIYGADQIANANVQRLEVKLRFQTLEELARELARAIANARQDGATKLWVAEFNIRSNAASVPAGQADDPPPNPWAQVAVHW
jgi:hypothetical protein